MNEMVIGKYIRLSLADGDLMTDEGKSESESISHQRDLIRNFIEARPELACCKQLEFFDDGFTGRNFERPAFERLLEQVKQGKINCVIVKDFSRFGRDYIELGDYLERIFPFLGVRFISVNDHYDSQDYKGTTGGLDVVLKNIVYDFYSKDLSVKVKTAKYQKMKQGKYLGGCVPYGLMKDPKDKHKLMPDPEAAAVVREIFDMAIAKMRLVDIARELNGRGVLTPAAYYRKKHPKSSKFAGASSKSCWEHNNLRKILQQEMYYGAVVGHKRQVTGVGGKHTEAVPKEEQIIVEGRHEGIVTKEEFLKAQEIFVKRGRVKNTVEKTYPLYRKVKCGVCGRAMGYRFYSVRWGEYRYFSCPHAKEQIGEGGCCRHCFKEDDLNAVVWESISRLIGLTDKAKDRIRQRSQESGLENVRMARELAKLQQSREKCDADKFANMDQFMAGAVGQDVYQKRRAELTRQGEVLDEQVKAMEQRLHEAELAVDDGVAEVVKQMETFAGATELDQKMVGAFVEKVLVYDLERVEIVWKFSDEVYEFIVEE